MSKGLTMWRAQRIEDMSRDELINALNEMANMWKASQDAHRHTLEVWQSVRPLRA